MAERKSTAAVQRSKVPHARPDNAIFCGLAVSLSVIARVPANEPGPDGANVTEILHEAPDARFVAKAP